MRDGGREEEWATLWISGSYGVWERCFAGRNALVQFTFRSQHCKVMRAPYIRLIGFRMHSCSFRNVYRSFCSHLLALESHLPLSQGRPGPFSHSAPPRSPVLGAGCSYPPLRFPHPRISVPPNLHPTSHGAPSSPPLASHQPEHLACHRHTHTKTQPHQPLVGEVIFTLVL